MLKVTAATERRFTRTDIDQSSALPDDKKKRPALSIYARHITVNYIRLVI